MLPPAIRHDGLDLIKFQTYKVCYRNRHNARNGSHRNMCCGLMIHITDCLELFSPCSATRYRTAQHQQPWTENHNHQCSSTDKSIVTTDLNVPRLRYLISYRFAEWQRPSPGAKAKHRRTTLIPIITCQKRGIRVISQTALWNGIFSFPCQPRSASSL